MTMALALALALIVAANIAQAAPSVPDSLAQRLLACTVCHGREGRAAADGFYPRIAGKPAGYLLNQLTGFRDGRRHYDPMTALIDPLSADYLRRIAIHFAALDLPYPPPQPPTAPPAVLALGRALVLDGDAHRDVPPCVACHGAALTGVAPAIPGLLGLPRDYLVAQLGAWRTGRREALAPDCMAAVAKALAPDEVAAVAQWLAAQPVPVPAAPATALPRPLPRRCGSVAP
jgi:cytochrome c553